MNCLIKILLIIRSIYRRIKKIHFHKWEYYEYNNNFDRVCTVCNKAEHLYKDAYGDEWVSGLKYSLEMIEGNIKEKNEKNKYDRVRMPNLPIPPLFEKEIKPLVKLIKPKTVEFNPEIHDKIISTYENGQTVEIIIDKQKPLLIEI